MFSYIEHVDNNSGGSIRETIREKNKSNTPKRWSTFAE
jgi:hypothetical protein